MYWNEVKKISAAGGFIVSIIMLAINLIQGYELLYAAYISLIILFISSLLFLFCLHSIGNILATYLVQKKKEAAVEKKKQQREEKKQKVANLKHKRESLEGQLSDKFDELTDK